MANRVSMRPFEAGDAAEVEALFAAYMEQIYAEPNAMTAAVLVRDTPAHFRLMLAVDGERPVGFAAWRLTYDLHHSVPGAEIPDLYVLPGYRGRALALRLVGHVGREAMALGCKFIRGEVLTDQSGRTKLVRRVTVGFASETAYLAGKALRTVAALADTDLRTLVAGLPAPEDNREP
jgi:GNAT superfamily N-acetyltransferase